jgi:hypothetical protein
MEKISRRMAFVERKWRKSLGGGLPPRGDRENLSREGFRREEIEKISRRRASAERK